ncbi:MAG: hypothetical protein KF760_29275 [Candidatus Eremiobacteraeota bacterium]|nr:hypothetical protein [Candidatus Eremiobacteraeota bacterium]MCW5865934.1 hypothetical protein [Candidatus Eremiobacteraeota bacterium]
MKKLALLLSLAALPARADSPLTSTDFWTAYKDVPEVVTAHDIERLNTRLGYYLLSNASIDKKAAVINALSWNYNGRQNAQLFTEILGQKYKTTDVARIKQRLTGEERFCLAYLTALDDYFHVDSALTMAREARRQLGNSFTVAIVTELIDAQKNFGGATPLWNYVAPVLNDKKLKQDLRPRGRKVIFDYMALYKRG